MHAAFECAEREYERDSETASVLSTLLSTLRLHSDNMLLRKGLVRPVFYGNTRQVAERGACGVNAGNNKRLAQLAARRGARRRQVNDEQHDGSGRGREHARVARVRHLHKASTCIHTITSRVLDLYCTDLCSTSRPLSESRCAPPPPPPPPASSALHTTHTHTISAPRRAAYNYPPQ